MDKLNIKMARFVELSKKFTKEKNDIQEITDIINIMGVKTSVDVYSHIVNIFDPTIVDGKEIPTKSERELLEDGITNRWNLYKDYEEFIELQEILNSYFKAEVKL